MATICPSYLRAPVMRVTRLNNCGQPVYGECSQVVSDGFVTVTLSAEVEEGETITVTKASGKQCINDRSCDQLNWYNTEIEFCQVDPSLIQIMNPTWELITDHQGDIVGYDAVGDLSCDTGFALEIWLDTYGAGDVCTGEESAGAWGYMLLPWVVGGAPGDIEIGNDAISFSFAGRTKIGSRWRRGPYPVQLQPNGAPGPLLTPIGPKTHYRLFTTTIRPPEPECGCLPVDRPTPDPAEFTLTADPNDPTGRTVQIRVDNHGFGNAIVQWCDGTQSDVKEMTLNTKTFADDETVCLVRVCDKQTPQVCVERTISIPMVPDAPLVDLTCAGAGSQNITAKITLPPQASGTVLVSWGDGTAEQEVSVAEGSHVIDNLPHTYAVPGVFTVTVRRKEAPSHRSRRSIQVPCTPGPVVGLGAGVAANSVTANVTPEAGKTFTYQYDTGAVLAVPGPGAIPETVLTRGTHTLTVCETATTRCTVKTFNVPFNDPEFRLTGTQDAVDPLEFTFATVKAPGTTAVFDYGDGSPVSAAIPVVAGVASITYTYAASGTYDATVTSGNQTRQVTVETVAGFGPVTSEMLLLPEGEGSPEAPAAEESAPPSAKKSTK